MCLKIALYSLFGQPGFCLIFILSKKKSFQSEALLKMPPSSPSMEEFGRDKQNKQRFIFPKIRKTQKKLQVSNTISCIWRLLALLVIYYNNSLNTETQKQNET